MVYRIREGDMGLTVQKGFFDGKDQALDDIRQTGTWPTTFVSGLSEGRPVHWHDDDVHVYVMEGETSFLDNESGQRTPVGPGDKVIVPARCLHAEGRVEEQVVYIIGLPGPRTPETFLVERPPEEL